MGGPSGSTYTDQRTYSDRYHSYVYSGSSANSHYNNHHRIQNNNNNRHEQNLPINDHHARRTRHTDMYSDSRNDNRNRKDTLAMKYR